MSSQTAIIASGLSKRCPPHPLFLSDGLLEWWLAFSLLPFYLGGASCFFRWGFRSVAGQAWSIALCRSGPCPPRPPIFSDGLLVLWACILFCPFIWVGFLTSFVGAFVRWPVGRQSSRCVAAGFVPRAPLIFLMACWCCGPAFFLLPFYLGGASCFFRWGFRSVAGRASIIASSLSGLCPPRPLFFLMACGALGLLSFCCLFIWAGLAGLLWGLLWDFY